MPDPLLTGGVASGGSILGALAAWFGIKKSVQDGIDKDIGKVDKRIDSLAETVQFKSTCVVQHEGVGDKFKHVNEKIDNVHTDVKAMNGKLDNILEKM